MDEISRDLNEADAEALNSADTEESSPSVNEEPPKSSDAVDAEDAYESADEIDYEALIASDIAQLKAEFPELSGIEDVTDLHNPLRYAALRDLGLSPAEAYLATAKRSAQDTRSHLKSAHGRNAVTQMGMMTQRELAAARDLFPDLSDSQLQQLYKRVTK
jgi:hypothetical protein